MTEHMGAVIVKNDEIISTGYNGAPRGVQNCCDRGTCFKDIMPKPPTGATNMECRGVHAPMNAIINASREEMLYATMYVFGWDAETGKMFDNMDSCTICKRLIMNSGIEEVIYADKNGIMRHMHPEQRYGYRQRTWRIFLRQSLCHQLSEQVWTQAFSPSHHRLFCRQSCVYRQET